MTIRLNLRRNAIFALVEVISSALVLFFLYRLVVVHLGLRALGVWSLVLATTSLIRLGDLGAATGLGRFMAVAYGRGEASAALVYVETAMITNVILYSVISCCLYWPLSLTLETAVGANSVGLAHQLLPFALISFTLLNVIGVVTGALLGLQRADLKTIVTISSLVIQFAAATVLTRKYGLVGLAIAQIAQSSFVIAAGWFLVLRQLRLSFRLPTHWSPVIFRTLLGFGMKLQAASIISFLYEPATKFVLSSLGGLEALGLFEMVQKMVQQVRQLVVGPSQILMPAFAHYDDKGGDHLVELYDKAVVMSILIGLPLMITISAISPLVSWMWIGHSSHLFVVFTVLLATGWFLNLVSAPAYLLGIGTGNIGWNIAGHFLISGGSPALGWLLGHFFGGVGVVIASSCMLSVGSVFTMVMNCRTRSIPPLPSRTKFCETIRMILKSKPRG